MSINWSDEHIRAHFPESDWLAENAESRGGRVLQFPRKGNGRAVTEAGKDTFRSSVEGGAGASVKPPRLLIWAAVLCSPLVILGMLWWVKS